MTATSDLLTRVTALGIRLGRDGGDILVEGKLSDDIITELKQHKAELLEVLTQQGASGDIGSSKNVQELAPVRSTACARLRDDPLQEAKHVPQSVVRVYEYQLVDYVPTDQWMTLIAPKGDLGEIRRMLGKLVGRNRVRSVREKPCPNR